MHDRGFGLSGRRQVQAVYKMYACRAIYTLVQHGVWHLTSSVPMLYRRCMHLIGRLDGGRAWQLLQWAIFQTVFSTCNVASLAFCLQWVKWYKQHTSKCRWMMDRAPSVVPVARRWILTSNLVQTAHVKMSTNNGSCTIHRTAEPQPWLISFSYSVCHFLKVVTETCHLFFWSATEELLELVPTLCCFVAHASSFTIAQISLPHGNYCHTHFLTTPLIALAGRPATVSARSLNCSALGKFASEFGRWPTVIIHSEGM